MNIKQVAVILVLCIALLVIPIVWLTLRSHGTVPFLTVSSSSIIILGSLVVVIVITRKTNYKPYQQPYQHESVYAVRRMEKAFASGMATTLIIGFITKSLIQSLLPRPLWIIYLIILFVLGAIIGDS